MTTLFDQDLLPRDCEIAGIDWTKGMPVQVVAYHGTTHAFDRFDADAYANPEGAFGRVHYFTSSRDDAEVNYACEGADLKSRIENGADRLVCEIEGAPEEFGLPKDASADACHDKAMAIKRDELLGVHPRVLTCALTLARPFVVDGRAKDPARRARPRTPLLFPDLEDDCVRAEEEVMASHGFTDHNDDYWDARDLHDEEIYERIDEIREAACARLRLAFDDVIAGLDIEEVALPDTLFDDLEGLTHDRFHEILDKDEGILYLECPEGHGMLKSEFIARVIESLGFDSIVLLSADQNFGGMNMGTDTVHLHVFDRHSDRIEIVEVEAMEDDLAIAA